MADKATVLQRFDTAAIARLFPDYVNGMMDKERHTPMACAEVGVFEQFCTGAFPGNIRLQNGLYEKMMNVAVEYEESGFIAGFRYAMKLLSSQEEVLSSQSQIPTLEGEQSQPEAVNASKLDIKKPESEEYAHGVEFRKSPPREANFIEDTEHITTVQIADMFDTTNYKVVRRIEKLILPYCDEETKKHFVRVDGYNIQHKKCVFYRMDNIACKLYVKELEPKKNTFVNIAGGIAKLEELMQRMFPAEKVTVPV